MKIATTGLIKFRTTRQGVEVEEHWDGTPHLRGTYVRNLGIFHTKAEARAAAEARVAANKELAFQVQKHFKSIEIEEQAPEGYLLTIKKVGVRKHFKFFGLEWQEIQEYLIEQYAEVGIKNPF